MNLTGKSLTPRQREVLNFIVSYTNDRGYPPSLREIGRKMGIASTNGVTDHLRALQRKGWLKVAQYRSRAIALTDTAKREYTAGSCVGSLPDALEGLRRLVKGFPDNMDLTGFVSPYEGAQAVIDRVGKILVRLDSEG